MATVSNKLQDMGGLEQERDVAFQHAVTLSQDRNNLLVKLSREQVAKVPSRIA